MHNGCILNGGVGTGKSRTALAYYHCLVCGGRIKPQFVLMQHPIDLYIITTARKRDTLEWEGEMVPFLLYNDGESEIPYKGLTVKVDSWNNISKYAKVSGAFFIFDEQRLVGNGAWVHAFYKIAKNNQWILLSATPGDTWTDYIPVFVANGYYKNRTEFMNSHCQMKKMGTYWKVDRYFGIKKLEKIRDAILVNMEYKKPADPHHIDILCEYDRGKYRELQRTKWNPWKSEPCQNAGSVCYVLRRLVNSDPSRRYQLLELLDDHPKVIIFYNFDYELDSMKQLFSETDIKYAEWNGHKHEPVPTGKKWCYLVQYSAGGEGWNCITTDTIIFYSQNYSYKVMTQAAGRIDRLNTPFKDLYYYHLKSKAPIDVAISRAIKEKKIFNEKKFVGS